MKHSIVIERTDHNGAENKCPFQAQTWDLKIGDYSDMVTLTHVFKFTRPHGLLSDLLHQAYIEAKLHEANMIDEIESAYNRTKEKNENNVG